MAVVDVVFVGGFLDGVSVWCHRVQWRRKRHGLVLLEGRGVETWS